MQITNLLHFADRQELRQWLECNHDRVGEC